MSNFAVADAFRTGISVLLLLTRSAVSVTFLRCQLRLRFPKEITLVFILKGELSVF